MLADFSFGKSLLMGTALVGSMTLLQGCGNGDDPKPDGGGSTKPTSYTYGRMDVDGGNFNDEPANRLGYSQRVGYGESFTAIRDVAGTNYADVAALAELVKDSTKTPFKDINTRTGAFDVYLPEGISNTFSDAKDNHVTMTLRAEKGAILHFQDNNRSVLNTRAGLRESLSRNLAASAKKTYKDQPNRYSFNYSGF